MPWETRDSQLRSFLARSRWRIWLLGALCLSALWATWAKARQRQRIRVTHAAIAEVQRAVSIFRAQVDRCPASTLELLHPPVPSARYLSELPADGWGTPLFVRCPGRRQHEGAEVVSAGPSGSLLVDDNIY